MNEKMIKLIDSLVEEVSQLNAGSQNDIEKIWDNHYDSVACMASNYTTTEDEQHKLLADAHNRLDELSEGHSFECEYCGETFYGIPFMFQGEQHCENCYDQHKDDFNDA